jgi:hypothetical protein
MKTTQNSRILNCILSSNTENDWLYDDALAAGFSKKAKALPKSVDLRETWWNISDQGATGSCVGQATADGLLRWHFVKKGLIKQDELLSVRFIWMSAKETDEFRARPETFIEEAGTSLKAALDIARKYGCVTDKLLPFKTGSLYSGSERTFYAMASRYRIVNYFNLTPILKDKLDTWKQWLASGNGPILTRLNVDKTWDEASKTKGKLEVFQPKTARGGHAICIVGYSSDGFIVRNSWGTGWGDKGFAYASVAYAQKAFDEAYGVSV